MDNNLPSSVENKSCTSGCPDDTSGYRVLNFPGDKDEKRRWVMNLPNKLNPDDVTEHWWPWKKRYKVTIV